MGAAPELPAQEAETVHPQGRGSRSTAPGRGHVSSPRGCLICPSSVREGEGRGKMGDRETLPG